MKKFVIFCLFFLCLSFFKANASNLLHVTTKVNYIRSYAIGAHNELDIQIDFDSKCPSSSNTYYLEKSGDYQTALSILLAAQAANKDVVVHYETGYKPNFSGSSGFCRIYSVGIKR